MGMAASQARFLGLTARKTNVEFEGQQINQQRTALANQSANYYNDMLGMSVPTPPSVDNYTKVVYSFNDGALTNEITALIAQNNGDYKVSYLQQWEDDFAPVTAASSLIAEVTRNTDYRIGDYQLRELCDTTGIDSAGNYTGSDPYILSLSNSTRLQLQAEEAELKSLMEKEFNGNAPCDWYVRYVENTSDGTWKPYIYKKSDVTGANYDPSTGFNQSQINCYTIGHKTRSEEIKMTDAKIEKDATGRYINIEIEDKNGVYVKYALTTSTITDQDAYNDAMNQYEFDKAKYDQTIQEINAKIEIIQAEDKNLELRLKQLDTEQDAISTEMDAVQKVIEKNTENSFKTFG